jgi:hypothetical protein
MLKVKPAAAMPNGATQKSALIILPITKLWGRVRHQKVKE